MFSFHLYEVARIDKTSKSLENEIKYKFVLVQKYLAFMKFIILCISITFCRPLMDYKVLNSKP